MITIYYYSDKIATQIPQWLRLINFNIIDYIYIPPEWRRKTSVMQIDSFGINPRFSWNNVPKSVFTYYLRDTMGYCAFQKQTKKNASVYIFFLEFAGL